MVDTRKLADFSVEERQKLLLDVYEVYKKHGVEKNLESPQLVDQLITDVASKSFERELIFKAEGSLKADQADSADKITEEVKDLLKGVAADNKKVDISAKIGAGDQIAPIENANYVFQDGKTTVEHKQGQVILYDLWATWCPPCQKPMAHNQEMLTKNKENWGSNVRIIGLSIDNSPDVVKKHVEAKGWGAVEHYHVSNGECKAS
jgi:thiol-disulfide isomerase/thioredoxin